MANTMGIDYDADTAETAADSGETFTFGGTGYACTGGTVSKGHTIESSEGYLIDVAAVLMIQASLFSTLPVAGNKGTYRGTEYRIIRVETGEDSAALRISLAEVTA